MSHDRVVRALTRLGGCATWRGLRGEGSARRIRAPLAAGAIRRGRRDRYQLPVVDEHQQVAHRTSGTRSHLSAAVGHGWAVKTLPEVPWVTYRPDRHLRPEDRAAVRAFWRALPAADVAKGITAPVRTVLDCARDLPFDEALAVADSALRAKDVTLDELRAAAATATGRGVRQLRRVVAHADGRAANPFESVLRAIVLEFPELDAEPQHRVWDRGLWATVDLGDPRLRLALEAEGFAAHRTRKDLHRDCRRYTELSVWGWTVFRFSWEDVMLEPERVRWAIRGWLAQRRGEPVPAPPRAA